MVLKFQYHPLHKNGTEILLPSVKFLYRMIRRPLMILSEPYLIEPSQMLRHATANAKILFTSLFHTASTVPLPATPHIWNFPTPRSLSRGHAAWSALTVWHSEHANYTIPGRFPSIFFAITYVRVHTHLSPHIFLQTWPIAVNLFDTFFYIYYLRFCLLEIF